MQVLIALADPTRLRIVEMLAQRERSAGEIVSRFKMSAPAISQHLRILHDARLVAVRVEGQRRIQMLDPRGIEEIEQWITRTKRVWEHRLDALEQVLRDEDAKQKRKHS